MKISSVNDAFLKFVRRAEANERSRLVETFVDAGPLFALLSSFDHQIMYGRRGTGKTHALYYLAETRNAQRDAAIYVDMRTVGSTGGIYSDPELLLSERATRLLQDTLLAFHEQLLNFSLDEKNDVDLSQAGPILDELVEAATAVKVVGTTEATKRNEKMSSDTTQASAGAQVGTSGLFIAGKLAAESALSSTSESQVTESGVARHRVQFGTVRQSISRFVELIAPRRIWLLLDEWSAVPLDLQPYLADLLRRSVFPAQGVTTKVGAIEHRSNFRLPSDQGDYIGIEVGADATADLNLDDFMVFDNDASRAKAFFQEFLFKHFKASVETTGNGAPDTPQKLIQQGFTQKNAFDEFVRAVEGVPRDALNILAIAAQKAMEEPLSVRHIRIAANTWYQRDKEAAVSANADAHELLHWIIDQVIGERRARAFLLRTNVRNTLIDALFDARVLHILKRNVSAHDQPGARYIVYKLDFGCYVDLINTARAPQGLLPVETDADTAAYVEVPPDDYRSIRRAILDIDQFASRLG